MKTVELDDIMVFLHKYSYCIKTEIPLGKNEYLVVGHNPGSTLYDKDYNWCAWYTRHKIQDTR